jgi:hypothetical protein
MNMIRRKYPSVNRVCRAGKEIDAALQRNCPALPWRETG